MNRAVATVVADAKSKFYGEANPTLTAVVTGQVVGGDAVNYTLGTTAVALSGIGDYPITVTLGSNPNYDVSKTDNTLTVNRAVATVVADAKSKFYGETNPALTAVVTGQVVGGDAVNYTLGTTAVALSGIGDYPITVTLGSNPNYDLTKTDSLLTVKKAVATVVADAKSKFYGTDNPALTAVVTGAVVGGDPVNYTLATTAVKLSPAASYPITVTLGANPNYNVTPTDSTLTVNRAVATVVADAKNKFYGTDNPALTAVVTGAVVGGEPVNYTLATTAVTLSGVGPYSITVTLGTNPNYDVTKTDSTLTVNRAVATVVADAKSKIYGETNPPLTAVVTGAVVGGDPVNYTLATTAAPFSGVGSYPITVTLGLNPNYQVTKTDGTLAVTPRPATVVADGKTKPYGDDNPALTAVVTGTVNGDTLNYTLATTATKTSGIGPYPITVTLGANPNYDVKSTDGALTVTPRPVTVTVDAKSKVYGDTDPALTYQITSGTLVGTDAFTGSLTRDAGSDVAAYAIKQGTLALSANYALTYVGATFQITPRPVTVTADAKSKTYGDTDPALTYQVTSGTLVGTDAFAGSLTRDAGENVAAYPIYQGTVALNGNYTLTYVAASLTIAKRAVTVTADAKTKVYGEPEPALTYQITSGSLAFSDGFTGSLTRDAGENVGDYAIKQGSLALSGNYTLTYVGATFQITPRPATVTADAKSIVYGDTDPALTYQVTSGTLVGTDAFTGSLTRDAGENVGDYAIKQGTLALSSNYDLSYVGANLAIDARKVTVTADPQTKIYGDTDPALTYKVTAGNLVTDDTFRGALTRTAGETVGSYAIGQGTLGLSTNYDLTYVGASFTISKRAATWTTIAANKTYGDADPSPLTMGNGNFLANDGVTATYSRATGETAMGSPYHITATLSAATGVLDNYTITNTGAEFTVNKRAATVTAGSGTKVYGVTPDPDLGATAQSGFLPDDVAGVTLASTRATGENVGDYETTPTATGGNVANYDVTYVKGSFTITKASSTVTVAPVSVAYDGTAHTPTAVVTGVGTGITQTVSWTYSGSCSGVAPTTVAEGSSCTARADYAGDSNHAASFGSGAVTISKAGTTTTVSAAPVVYSVQVQTLTLTARVKDLADHPVTNSGSSVRFTVFDGPTQIGAGANATYDNATATWTASFTLPAYASAGLYNIQAVFSEGANYLKSMGTEKLTVSPTDLLSDVAAADADFKRIDGFDVLFGKGSTNTLLKLKNTNPGTFHYQLTLTNETGVVLHDRRFPIDDKRGGSVTVFLTVPALPGNVGPTMPVQASQYVTNSAFTVQGRNAVHAHPDDRTDDMPMTVKWIGALPAGASQCSMVPDTMWLAGQPTDGAIVKCIKIEGLAIPRHGRARIDVNYEFALKNIDGWGLNAQTMFRAGFAFKSATTVQLDDTFPVSTLASKIYNSNQAAGLVGAGQKVTAIGGFIFDPFGSGVQGVTVRLFNSLDKVSSCGDTTNIVASATSFSDGFYYIWNAGLDQALGMNSLPDGVKYVVQVCSQGQPVKTFTLANKLASKEFDEEDLYFQ